MIDLTSTGKYIALILRHKPETIGITLDEHGWANVDELIAGIQKTRPEFDMEVLKEIVRTNNKRRYAFNEDHTKIRANQGHSIPMDVELREAVPPEILNHGTGERAVPLDTRTGTTSREAPVRPYVHRYPNGDQCWKKARKTVFLSHSGEAYAGGRLSLLLLGKRRMADQDRAARVSECLYYVTDHISSVADSIEATVQIIKVKAEQHNTILNHRKLQRKTEIKREKNPCFLPCFWYNKTIY